MRYNWQQPDWPDFLYKYEEVEMILSDFQLVTGEVNGVFKSLPENLRQETLMELILAEAIKTSEIEGELLSRPDVMSSVRNNIGWNLKPELVHDSRAAGIGQLMVNVRKTFSEPLSKESLWEWHKMVMADAKGIRIGQWRKGPEAMQIVSGPVGKEKIHYEAPPAISVNKEMLQFIKWFNITAPNGKNELASGPIRAAIAHLYFESIHPFEDGNGRIGRAIAEKSLSQTLGRPVMLSLSKTIESCRKDYYQMLSLAQSSNIITEWVSWFVKIVWRAQLDAQAMIDFTLQKSLFFDRHRDQLNARQQKAISRMLEEGPDGFQGGMTAKKYMSIVKTSKATATRDLQQLAGAGIFIASGGGRTTHYQMNLSR